jgi:hypothetical protein
MLPAVYPRAGGCAKRIATRSGKRREQEMTLHNLRPVRALTLAAAISALAAPAASAIPVEDFIPATRGDAADRTQPVRVVQVGADQGFDWGDAGIGATGVIALAAIGAGAALATGRRPRARHNPQPVR